MKTQSVSYSKVFNLGNYSNEKIEVAIELEPGDNPAQVLDKARNFAEQQHKLNKEKERYLQACDILTRQDDYTGNQLKQAQSFKDEYEAMLTNTPKLLS